MADIILDSIVTVVIFLVIGMVLLVVLPWVIFKYLGRRRFSKKPAREISDQAYNALISTRAIASALAQGGMRSEQATGLIRQAEEAHSKGDSRAVMDLTAQAKEVLMKEKKRQQQIGDLVKLPESKQEPATSVPTEREKLEKEIPKNYMQSKFVMSLAQKAIDDSKMQGKDITEADRLFELARKSFDSKDYDSALKYGVQARKATEEIVIEIKATDVAAVTVMTEEAKARTCGKCGATLKDDDQFCRKCGSKVEMLVCTSCGAKLKEGDSFCRKCGVAVVK